MSNKICVYTCITGDYDNLHEIEHPEKDIDYFCFTNNSKLTSKTWKIIQIKNNGLSNHILSRQIKILGHPILQKYDIGLWMDASIVWDKSIKDFIQKYYKSNTFSSFKHHIRTSIYQEAIACLQFRKDSKSDIINILDFLKSENFPDDLGLCEMTVFIRNFHDTTVNKAMKIWFDAVKTYSKRDQLSFMYAAWKANLKIDFIELNVWENTWFHAMKHNYNFKIDSCHVYYGDSSKDFDFNKYFIYPYKKTKDTYKFTATVPCDTEKIELGITNIIGISYHDIKTNLNSNNIEFQNIYLYNQDNITISNYNIIHLYTNLKKGQKISFSVKILPSRLEVINNYIEHQSVEYISLLKQYQKLQTDYYSLEKQNLQTQTEFSNVLNSKGWKALESARKIIHPFN